MTDPFRLLDVEVHPDQNQLVVAGRSVKVEPKVMAVLCFLAERAGNVVSRGTLLDEVWVGTVVSDEAVTRCVSELRSTLGDSRSSPRFIQTVPRRGYTLIAAPIALEVAVATQRRWLAIAAAAAIAVVVATASFFLRIGEPTHPRAVAVLPFEPAAATVAGHRGSGSGLGSGMAEDILRALADSGSLSVAARSASFRFDAADDPVTVAEQLGVGALVAGRWRKDGDRLVVDVELVDGRDGMHLWSESFNGSLDEIFEIEDKIANGVLSALDVAMATPYRVARITTSFEALDYYHLGRYHWHQRTAESLERAAELFESAIELDPRNALAYSGLADSYLLLTSYGELDDAVALERAEPAVEKALVLAPELAEANASNGMLALHRGEFAAAEQAFRRAIEARPSYEMALMWLGNALQTQGRVAEAHDYYQRAYELDPRHPTLRHNLIHSHVVMGDYETAESMVAALIEPAPMLHKLVGMIALARGRFDEAERIANRLVVEMPTNAEGYLLMAGVESRRGVDPSSWFERAERNLGASRHLYLLGLAQGIETTRPVDLGEVGAEEQLALGVCANVRGDAGEAVAHLEAGLSDLADGKYWPEHRLTAVAHLLAALPPTDTERFASWAAAGRAAALAARADGHGSFEYLKAEGLFYAAAGDQEAMMTAFRQLREIGPVAEFELLDDARMRNVSDQRVRVAELLSGAQPSRG